MRKRPIAVLVIAVLLMLTGAFGLIGDCFNFKSLAPHPAELPAMLFVHALAIVAGVFLLRGENWARWLAVAWMAFHVAISLGRPQELIMHALFLLLFAWFLFFTAESRSWFSPPKLSS